MKAIFKKFVQNESGAALVEYGIALLVVILVGAGGLLAVANGTQTQFDDAGTAVTTISTTR